MTGALRSPLAYFSSKPCLGAGPAAHPSRKGCSASLNLTESKGALMVPARSAPEHIIWRAPNCQSKHICCRSKLLGAWHCIACPQVCLCRPVEPSMPGAWLRQVWKIGVHRGSIQGDLVPPLANCPQQTLASWLQRLKFSPARSQWAAHCGLERAAAMGILGHAGANRVCLGAAAQQLAPVQAASPQLGNPEPPMPCH